MNDFSITFSTYHSFEKEFNERHYLAFTPKINIIGGTSHFFNSNLKKELIKGSTVDDEVDTKFTLIAFEFGLPISYTYRKFTIEPSFKYSLPMNQPKPLANPTKKQAIIEVNKQIEQYRSKPTGIFVLSLYFTFD